MGTSDKETWAYSNGKLFTGNNKKVGKWELFWAKGSTVLFSFWRNKVTKLCKSACRTFYMVSVNSQETTPKKWWDNIKRLSGQSRSAPLSTFVVNDSVLSGLDLPEVINDSFSKISSDMQPLEYSPVPVDHTPDEFIITPEAIERSL